MIWIQQLDGVLEIAPPAYLTLHNYFLWLIFTWLNEIMLMYLIVQCKHFLCSGLYFADSATCTLSELSQILGVYNVSFLSMLAAKHLSYGL